MNSYEHYKRVVQEHSGLFTALAATTGAALWYYWNRRPALTFPVSVDDQSVQLEGHVRASQFAADGKLVEYYYEDAQTCHEAFVRGMRVSNNGRCLGARTGPNQEYEWLSYREVFTRAQAFGSACIGQGLKPQNDTFVGIFANNCHEWVITEQACNMYSMVLVPLYDTLGPEACTYIINQTAMTTVVCDKVSKATALLASAQDTPSLSTVVVVEQPTQQLKDSAAQAKVTLMSFTEMEETGARALQDIKPPRPDDLCTICYTSGTTGNPKGVMLSHKNLISNTAAVLYQVPDWTLQPEDTHISYLPLAHMFERIVQDLSVTCEDIHVSYLPLAHGFERVVQISITSEDVHVSYLPLAHMFERIVQNMIYQHGAGVGFFRGDVKLLIDDLQALRPTVFPTVPRLLNRIYDKVMLGIQGSAIKTFLFKTAMSQKMKMLKRGVITNSSIWDKLVFKKIQASLGGRVKIVVTGSAPLADNVLDFARCAFGCKFFEGYGQTESTAGISFTLTNEFRPGHVGTPLPCNHVKLVDVPEMEYYARDNKGEVCFKGANTMRGYYKDPEKTRETIDEEGWLHTGDIGMWLPTGALKIIDRKKHIFKLAQGEYLAPEKIEQIYTRSSLVAQAFVDGSSLQSFAVGVIVPDPEALPAWAKSNGMASASPEQLCRSAQLKKDVLADITRVGKEAGLKGFEQAKDIYLEPELFSVENGLLTPTFKSKRPVLRKHFSAQIQALYESAQ